MNINERVRALREDNDLTQSEIACALGISQQSYSRYEIGYGYIPALYIKKLCKFYNVSADYILGYTDKPIPLNKK